MKKVFDINKVRFNYPIPDRFYKITILLDDKISYTWWYHPNESVYTHLITPKVFEDRAIAEISYLNDEGDTQVETFWEDTADNYLTVKEWNRRVQEQHLSWAFELLVPDELNE